MATMSILYDVPTYEGDFAAWSFHQAMLLRSGQLHQIDRARIAEELDSLGHVEFDKLESALRLVLMYMLKWDHQPIRRVRSWTTTIATQRKRVRRQLESNPSLTPRRDEAVADAYDDARRDASGETDLPLKTFPPACPYSWDDVTERAVEWPGDE